MSLLCFFAQREGFGLAAGSVRDGSDSHSGCHSLPTRSNPSSKFTKTKSRKPCGFLLFVLAQREGFEPSCALAQTDFESAPL